MDLYTLPARLAPESESMSNAHEVNEQELKRLDKKEKNYWVLTMVLLVVLSLTVITQYLSSYGFIPANLTADDHYKTTLSVGLPGLIILFCLYTTAKRKEIRFLKSTLYSQQFLLRRLAERTRELENTLAELEKADDVKNMLISTVSHELQTPLASIYTISQTLLNYDGEPATTRKFYNLISEESRRLSSLVRNLLDIAKMESGTMTWEIQAYPVKEVVRSAVEVTAVLAGERNIEVTDSVTDNLPLIPIDRDRLVQVLTNLIGNAIKFTPDGGKVKVSAGIATDREGLEGDAVRFSVRDTGVGIPTDQLCRIFERFHRGATPLGVRNRGTGLGLAISKEIVEHLGGQIWAESQQGAGSDFFFTIPILRDNIDNPTDEKPPADLEDAKRHDLSQIEQV